MMEVVINADPGPHSQQLPTLKHPVYLRRPDKNGVKLNIPEFIMLQDLQQTIQQELGVAKSRQILFISGRKFHQSPNQLLEIKENTIIHVHQKQSWEYRVICINVQILEGENLLKQSKEYTVLRTDTILRFLQQKLQINSALVVESGRKIDVNRSFAAEQILEGTSITIKIESQQEKGNQVQKDLMMLFEDEEELEEEQNFASNEKNQNQKPKGYIRVFNDTASLFDGEFKQPTVSFKKKNNPVCFKAIHNNPEDRNRYCWQKVHDKQTSLSKLAKKIKGKKTVLGNKIENKRTLSTSGRSKLREEIQRLFQYEGGARMRGSGSENKPIQYVENNQPIFTESSSEGSSNP